MTQGMTSAAWAERLRKVIPSGSCTMSKAARLTPEEPGVIVRGQGCRVWDADGREFIDFRNSLGPVTLGYRFPAVDRAIRDQLEKGIIFGHPHPLEGEVAEALREVIPCAEMVRFLKTGGEALAACIKIARAYRGRDHIVQVGYNGWLNSLAPSGRLLPGREAKGVPAGVPAALSALHHQAEWNDIQQIRALLEGLDVAAVVVAADYARMAEGKTFYPALRSLCDEHGTLLIYDEIVTGFRVATGGVQEYFGVKPDLAVFAKGMANGMPLSAFVGRRECMEVLERAVVSSTYAGETLSLAAAKVCIETYRREDVVGHLWRMGERMWTGANEAFRRHGLPLEWKGFWPCPRLVAGADAPSDLIERFMRAAYAEGVSLYTVSYVNFSHREADIAEALERLDRACAAIA